MGKRKWDEMMSKGDEKTMEDFILYLYDGYKKFGDNKYTEHILYITIRYVTSTIGECKNLKISKDAEKKLGVICNDLRTIKKAQKDKPNETIKEHKIPAKIFWEEFETKKEKGEDFTRADAKRWLKEAIIAVITNDEDKRLTAAGYRTKRHKNTYDQLGIELKDIKK